MCVSGRKKCLFFGKFGSLYFPVTSVSRFALLLCYRRFVVFTAKSKLKSTYNSSAVTASAMNMYINHKP